MIGFEGEILILTGSPGSGKTTAADALARLPGSSKVHIHSDDFWGAIKKGLIPPWLPESKDQNQIVVDIFAKVAEGYARGGYFVVLDGIVGPWFLPSFRTLGVPLHYIVLRAPLDEAIERCRLRGGDTLADPEPIAQLHGLFSSLGDFEHHALSTDGLGREEVVERVIGAMRSGAYRLGDHGRK